MPTFTPWLCPLCVLLLSTTQNDYANLASVDWLSWQTLSSVTCLISFDPLDLDLKDEHHAKAFLITSLSKRA